MFWDTHGTLSSSQFDFIGREGLEAPPTGQNNLKDSEYQCEKHSSISTSLSRSPHIPTLLEDLKPCLHAA